MGQFAFGLLAGVVVGLVMEWVIDWAGLMPDKSKTQTGRKSGAKPAASGAPTRTGSQVRMPSAGETNEPNSATPVDEE